MIRYINFKLDQSTKALRYRLFDNSSPFKPIWGVVLVIVLAGAFFYIVWPGLIKIILVAIFILLTLSSLKKLIRELQYKLQYEQKSQKDERRLIETSVAEPPLYSQTKN